MLCRDTQAELRVHCRLPTRSGRYACRATGRRSWMLPSSSMLPCEAKCMPSCPWLRAQCRRVQFPEERECSFILLFLFHDKS